MFELIKKWLKRPTVINFTVKPLSQDAAINVIECEEQMTPEIAKAVRDAWPKFCKSKAVVLGPGVALEQMNDEQLKDVGLMRVEVNETTQTAKQTTGDDTEDTETNQTGQ